MAERSFGPVVVRRRLGSELRRLRDRAGMSLDQVARELEVSPSKISRLENGQSPAKVWDVRNLLTLYGVDDEDYRRRAERWVNEGKSQGWWHPFSDAVSTDLDHYISLEEESAGIRHFAAPFLHGLLQIESYARAFLESVLPGLGGPELDRLVEVRMLRQLLLTRESPKPPVLHFVLDEGVLERSVGGDRVMADQLEHLLSLPSTVRLQVRSFGAPPHLAVLSPFTIFHPRESDTDPKVVNVESGYHDAYWTEPSEVTRFERSFDELTATAMSEADSRTLIAAVANRYRSRPSRDPLR